MLAADLLGTLDEQVGESVRELGPRHLHRADVQARWLRRDRVRELLHVGAVVEVLDARVAPGAERVAAGALCFIHGGSICRLRARWHPPGGGGDVGYVGFKFINLAALFKQQRAFSSFTRTGASASGRDGDVRCEDERIRGRA